MKTKNVYLMRVLFTLSSLLLFFTFPCFSQQDWEAFSSEGFTNDPVSLPYAFASTSGTTSYGEPFKMAEQGDRYDTISLLSASRLAHSVFLDNYHLKQRSLTAGEAGGGCICQGENVEICLGEEITIGCEASIDECKNYCYKWTPMNGAISNGTSEEFVAEAQLVVSPEETTTYLLTISDDTGEIVGEESFTVTVLGTVASISPSSALICPTTGNFVELTAFPNQGDFSYEWASTPAAPEAFPATATIQVDVPAVYTVSVTDNETGCVSVGEYELIDDSNPESAQAIKDFFTDRGFLEVEINITNEIFGVSGETDASRNPEYQYVTDLANRFVYFLETDVNIPEYLDDFLADAALSGFNRYGYITANDNFCTENAQGTSNVIEEIDQQYQSNEYAYWIHLWENPDDGNDCLFIQCITPTHENPMPETSAIAENILAFQEIVQNRTEIYSYASKDQQLFDILVNDLMDFCDGDLFDGLEVLYNDPDENNGNTDPDADYCTGLVSEQNRYCINVAGWPITVPDKSLLLYESATAGTASQPSYLVDGGNYLFDSRSLIGFMGIDGIPWRSHGYPDGQHFGFRPRDNSKGEPFVFPAISNYVCGINHPRTYFGSREEVGNCTHYSLKEYTYRSGVQDEGSTPVNEIPAGPRNGPPVQDLEESGEFCNDSSALSSTTSQSCIPHVTQSQIDLAIENAQINPFGHKGFVFKMQMHLASDPPDVTFWRIVYVRHDAVLPAPANHFTYYIWDCVRGGWVLMPDDWVIQEQQVEFIFALFGVIGEGLVSFYDAATSSPHGAYDYAGMIPVIGAPADLINAGWYLIEGEYGEAAFAAIGLIPILGDAVQWVRVGTKVYLRVNASTYRVAYYGFKNLSKELPLRRVMDEAAAIFPVNSDEIIPDLFKKYTRFLMESEIGNKTAKLLEDNPALLRTFKAAEDEGLSLTQKEALFRDLTETSDNAPLLVAAFVENADLVKAWKTLLNDATLRVKATHLTTIDNFFTKYPNRIEEFKTVLHDVNLHPTILDKQAFLQSIKIFDEIPTITNSDELVDVLTNARGVHRVSDLADKGITKFFRGTNLDVNGVPNPGNPNSIVNGTSTSTDPIVAAIYGINSKTNNSGSTGVLLIADPQSINTTKLVPANPLAASELEAIMDMTPTGFYGTKEIEISVADARSLISQITGHNLDSVIENDYLFQALSDAPRMTPAQIQEFYTLASQL